jgi:LacI family transcriptional regulator
MVTRDDVARRAGTSAAVVSYVINDGPRPVAAATRQRVLDAIRELGYQPNAAARALSRRRDDLIGLLVPNVDNPFFAMIATAVEAAAMSKGYTVVLCITRNQDERRAEYVRTLLKRQASGLILVGAAHEQDGGHGPLTSFELMAHAGTPMVSFDPLPEGATGTTLMPQNRQGARQVVEHLVAHGHERIGMLSGPRMFTAVREREDGWRAALMAAGWDHSEQWVGRCRFDRYEAYEWAVQQLAEPLPASALFVHTDEQAIGVIHACLAAGLSLPDDLAVVSFDGVREAALITPALTTMAQPIRQMGHRAVEILESHLAQARTGRHLERTDCELIIRSSCGC